MVGGPAPFGAAETIDHRPSTIDFFPFSGLPRDDFLRQCG
jgi:hypothetical protein